MSVLNTLKYHGRKVVLPVDKMKALMQPLLANENITHIVDFGAGTLFWSQWFARELGLNVLAVDTAYAQVAPSDDPGIALYTNIADILNSPIVKQHKCALFACDVIHHLPVDFWQEVLAQMVALFDVLIIKDIDANRKLGNFLNKMHDRIINGEKINNVYPHDIKNTLQQAGYAVQATYLPRLWYPHFMVMGQKLS